MITQGFSIDNKFVGELLAVEFLSTGNLKKLDDSLNLLINKNCVGRIEIALLNNP